MSQPIAMSQINQQKTKMEVVDFRGPAETIQRLVEIGLRKGMHVEFCGQAPFHGPLLYRAGTTMFALRPEEAACTLIKTI
jgi:Fe2+ transport system protein FeoA